MTKKQATHFGICQVCGSRQAYTDGKRIAKHGYTVDYGFFNGTCQGSDHLALEEDHAVADEIINFLQGKIGRLNEFVAAGPEAVKTVVVDVRHQDGYMTKRIPTRMNAEEFAAHFAAKKNPYETFEKYQGIEIAKAKNEIVFFTNFIRDMNARIEHVFGRALQERVVVEKSKSQREVYTSYNKYRDRYAALVKEGKNVRTRKANGYWTIFLD